MNGQEKKPTLRAILKLRRNYGALYFLVLHTMHQTWRANKIFNPTVTHSTTGSPPPQFDQCLSIKGIGLQNFNIFTSPNFPDRYAFCKKSCKKLKKNLQVPSEYWLCPSDTFSSATRCCRQIPSRFSCKFFGNLIDFLRHSDVPLATWPGRNSAAKP